MGLGYLERAADPADARVRWVGLSERGRDALAASRRANAEIGTELAVLLGSDRMVALVDSAWALLEWSGGAEAVRTRRVPDRR